MKRLKSQRPSEDLLVQLRDQVGFLRKSCALFYAGDKAEAKRIAACLRILLHDGGSCVSVLGQMGKAFRWRLADTAATCEPDNLLSHHGLVIIKLSTGPEGSKAEYVPRFEKHPPALHRFAPFWSWWNAVVFKDDAGNTFSRRDIVLFVANQDSGAHVDPAVDAGYVGLSREGGLGWKRETGETWKDDPVAPSLRQVAYEVLGTIEAAELAEPGLR